VVSCIPFVKPKLMKEELNGLFLAKHGDWLEVFSSPLLLSSLELSDTKVYEP